MAEVAQIIISAEGADKEKLLVPTKMIPISTHAQTIYYEESTGTTVDDALSVFHFEFLLTQITAALNPCAMCQVIERDTVAKIWASLNLVGFVAVAHFCYKVWVATMVFGGSDPDIRAARYIYINFCTLDGKVIPFWTDRIGQVIYMVGSFLLFLAVFKIRKLCKNRRRYTLLYLSSILVYLVMAYTPQVLTWVFSRHCNPPGAEAICYTIDPKTNRKKLTAFPIGSTVPGQSDCVYISHAYFLAAYFLMTFTLVGWLLFGTLVANSYIWWLRTPYSLMITNSKVEVGKKRLSPY